MKRPRGTGGLYKVGRIWKYCFSRDGISYRESAHTTIKTAAQAKLDARIREVEAGFVTKTGKGLKVSDLIESALAEYERQERRSLAYVRERWKLHLKPVFADLLASRVTPEKLENYANARVKEGAAKATVNREFALLRFAFNLARKRHKLQLVPWFPMFRESNTRTGFLEDSQYDKLAASCAKRGLGCRAIFEVAYQFGWRSGEIKTMRVRQADIAARTLRLEPHTTKNDEGREAVMPPRLAALVEQCAIGKRADDLLFDSTNFRKLWEAACKEAGVPDLLFHDLRRTAVRNLERRGIARSVAMMITGHKTEAVYRRYAIVAASDLQEAARKMALPLPGSSLTLDSHLDDSRGKADGKLLN
jgi:integrase